MILGYQNIFIALAPTAVANQISRKNTIKSEKGGGESVLFSHPLSQEKKNYCIDKIK